MSFTGSYTRYALGTWDSTNETYCQTNTSASDYGTCYNVYQKLYFVQSDTTTYPVGSLPCEKAGNCIRFTTNDWFFTFTILDNSSVKKQVLLYFVRSKHHTNVLTMACGSFAIGTEATFSTANSYPPEFFSGSPMGYRLATGGRCDVYDPITNSIFRITTQTNGGYRVNMEYYPNVMGLKIIGSFVNAMRNNTYFAVIAFVSYAVESSPSLIMPLDYNEYLSYNDLRSVVGWAADGVSQYGWNTNDIIRTVKDIYPDKAWAVFDDKTYTLYLYNLTPDYVPDWLIERLAPVSMKVLQSPSNPSTAKAWLDELNRMNTYNQPSS